MRSITKDFYVISDDQKKKKNHDKFTFFGLFLVKKSLLYSTCAQCYSTTNS